MSGPQFGGTIKLEGAKQYNADLANITSNLRLLSKEMEENGRTAADLAQKTELYSQKVRVQKRHIAEIEEALEKAKQQYGENSDEVQEWVTKLNNAQAKLVDMEKELKAAQKELDDFGNKFKQTSEKLNSTGEALTGFGNKISGLSTAAGAALAGITAIGLKSAAAADDLNTLSAVTGISTEELQKFAYASDRIDVSQETLTGSLRKLVVNMQAAQNGSEKQKKAFEELRVSYENGDGSLRSNVDVFYDLIDALGKVENSTKADALAMSLFGKSAQDLNPLIKGGSDSLKKLGAEAESAGLILSQDTLDGVNQVNDAVDKFKATMSAGLNKTGANIAPVLLPILEDMTEGFNKAVDGLSKFDKETVETGMKVLAFTVVLAPMAKGLGGVFTGLSNVVTGAEKAKAALAAMSAADVGLIAVTAAIAAMDAAFVYLNTHADDNNFAANELNKTLSEQQRIYRDSVSSIEENAQAQKDELSAVEKLVPRLDELSKKTDRTAAENAELDGIIKELNKKFPNLSLAIDETTGSINTQISAIDNLIEAQKREIETAAAMEKWQAAEKNRVSAEQTYDDAKGGVDAAYANLSDKEKGALYYVQKLYRQGIYAPETIDTALQSYADNNGLELKGLNLQNIEAYRAALKAEQLAKNRLDIASGKASSAEDEWKKLLGGGKGTMSGDAPHMNAGKEADKDLEDKVKRGIEVWKYRHDRGIISEEEYYNELERIRDQYFAKDSEEWRKYDLEIYNGRKKINSAQTKADEKASAERTKIAEQEAKERAKLAEQEAKEIQKAQEKAYKEQQTKSYAWISERVDREDFGDYGTSAKESYERIYQRALEAYRNGVIDIDALAAEADSIKAAKLQDYKTEKTKLSNFIDDRNFYDDWSAVNTNEEKVLRQMIDNAERYYADGILSYREYAEEVRQINRDIYSAQATEQETVLKFAQERVEQQLSEKRAEIDAQISALNQQVSDLRASYTKQDRQKRLAELKSEIADFQNAVTLRGQEHLKELETERERLLREEEIENLQRKNNEIIEQLEAEYKQLEVEKTSLLTKIEENTAQFAAVGKAMANMGEIVGTAVTSSITKVMQDNRVQNNYNTNNSNQYITAAQGIDIEAVLSPLINRLKG